MKTTQVFFCIFSVILTAVLCLIGMAFTNHYETKKLKEQERKIIEQIKKFKEEVDKWH